MKKKKKKKLNKGNLMILLSSLFMIVIGMYAVLNSSVFNTNKIDIKGNKIISEEEIVEILDIKDDKNIFMYDLKKMESKLYKNPYLENVEIKRKLPNKLNINIKEKEIYAIIKEDEDYCYIDKDGKLIEKIDDIDSKQDAVVVETEYIIEDDNEVKFKNEDTKKRLLYLLECIKDDNLYKKINKINYEKDDIINMYTKEGIEILLKNNESIKYNISRAGLILSDLQDSSKKTGVIDLSLDNYAVYRQSSN